MGGGGLSDSCGEKSWAIATNRHGCVNGFKSWHGFKHIKLVNKYGLFVINVVKTTPSTTHAWEWLIQAICGDVGVGYRDSPFGLL